MRAWKASDVDDLNRLANEAPGLTEALGALLNQREGKGGRLPSRVTLTAKPPVVDALKQIFTSRAVRILGDDRVRVDVALFLRDRGANTETELVEALYALTKRAPRDAVGSERALLQALDRGLFEEEKRAKHAVSMAFLRAQRAAIGRGEGSVVARARARGADEATGFVAQVVRCLEAVFESREIVRVQTFAARALGSSKALRPGGDLVQWVCSALLEHDPLTLRRLDEEGVPPRPAAQLANALEIHGIYRDEAAASVLCFGPIVYAKRGDRFDHVARHSVRGDASRITLHQLRDAVLERPVVRRVTIFENVTPFLDYVDACVYRGLADEVVLSSGGQANLAVVALVRQIASYGITMRHAGDLDRSGVLILRSLARRTGARLAPLLMDRATHRRFVARGQPIGPEERARLAVTLRADEDGRSAGQYLADLPCHELLEELHATGTWIEQEAFTDDCLDHMLA